MNKPILVTGANGFIAAHAVEQLLAKGRSVIGTVRDPNDPIRNAHLAALPGAGHLHLVQADLRDPDPFSAHVDVDQILHLASPYVVNVKDPQHDLFDPAVNGTLALLQAAARSPRVRRVVLTSSVAAITDEPGTRVLTEADWNDKSSLTRNPYYYSKTLAERAAWDFMTREKPGFDLVVINPFMVVGPAHTKAINTSTQMLADIMNGTYPVIMDFNWGFADVRDVAAAHIAALENPAAQGRYLCASANASMRQIVALIKRLGYPTGKVAKLPMDNRLGTTLLKLVSYAQPSGSGTYMRTHLGRVPRYDTSKIRRDLGISFRSAEISIAETLADLAKWGHIPAPVQTLG